MDNKKLAAAVAAVYACIKTSEEAAAIQAAESTQALAGTGVQASGQIGNVWGISGRQAQMQSGTMMQLRMFK